MRKRLAGIIRPYVEPGKEYTSRADSDAAVEEMLDNITKIVGLPLWYGAATVREDGLLVLNEEDKGELRKVLKNVSNGTQLMVFIR